MSHTQVGDLRPFEVVDVYKAIVSFPDSHRGRAIELIAEQYRERHVTKKTLRTLVKHGIEHLKDVDLAVDRRFLDERATERAAMRARDTRTAFDPPKPMGPREVYYDGRFYTASTVLLTLALAYYTFDKASLFRYCHEELYGKDVTMRHMVYIERTVRTATHVASFPTYVLEVYFGIQQHYSCRTS